jgi:hypothetical protein
MDYIRPVYGNKYTNQSNLELSKKKKKKTICKARLILCTHRHARAHALYVILYLGNCRVRKSRPLVNSLAHPSCQLIFFVTRIRIYMGRGNWIVVFTNKWEASLLPLLRDLKKKNNSWTWFRSRRVPRRPAHSCCLQMSTVILYFFFFFFSESRLCVLPQDK